MLVQSSKVSVYKTYTIFIFDIFSDMAFVIFPHPNLKDQMCTVLWGMVGFAISNFLKLEYNNSKKQENSLNKTCLQHLSIIHSAHSWVQLSLLRGSGTWGCQVKRLPLLCLLWLQTDWRRAKSQLDYCKSVTVIEASSLMWVRAIKHNKIAHLHSGTHHCVAMFAFCVWWVVSKKTKNR